MATTETRHCFPPICGRQADVERAIRRRDPVFASTSPIRLETVRSACALALHMHQPTIPAGGPDLRTASLISNLQHMLASDKRRTRRRAAGFARCYGWMAELIPPLVEGGKHPRIMLDYSGNLLWGLEQMRRTAILDGLRRITLEPAYQSCVEWLGTMWSHAVASSTPPEDFKLHLRAWQNHFLSLFGADALSRVRGFSPPEMQLPNDPDVAYAYVESLLECGYRWLLVQADTVERLDGSQLDRPHLPHRLVVRDSAGRQLTIAALIKTGGSNIELIARMQPLAKAAERGHVVLGGVEIPEMVTQVSDGENSRTMLTVFPHRYSEAVASLGTSGLVMLGGTEYLELIEAAGLRFDDFIPVQPIHQHRIWALAGEWGRQAVDRAIRKLRGDDEAFHLEGGAWVTDRSWVRGYESVVEPMHRLSQLFHEKIDDAPIDPNEHRYRNALLYLLLSQTSCLRYWGRGHWTGFAHEFCRRGTEILTRQF